MHTTATDTEDIERVETLLGEAADADPAVAVEPLARLADILEGLLDAAGDDH